MTTLREAAQQALEALENAEEDGNCEYGATAALRAALEQPEEKPVAWVITDDDINSLQVASIQRLIDRLKHAHHTDLRVRINGQDEWFQADWIKHLQRTHPTRREWRGLTDEEIRDLWSWSATVEAERIANTQQHAFARAVEAKLKEKNA